MMQVKVNRRHVPNARNVPREPALEGQTAGHRLRAAARASEDFHGTPTHEYKDVEIDVIDQDLVVGECGELVSMDIASVNGGIVHLKNFDGALLTQNPKGMPTQLFITGGDQSVPLEEFDIEDPHGYEILGHLKRIKYYTIKYHLGEDGGEANYKHRFGERDELISRKLKGVLPTVVYDTVNELLSIAGGRYDILPEGIDN